MKKYRDVFNKLESIILMFCILCVFSLIIFQGFFRDNSSSVFLNFNQLPTEIGYEPDLEKEFGYIILRLENEKFSDITVLINGENKHKFGSNKEIKLKVHNNDIIELDSSMYKKSTKVKITGISKNIIYPKLNNEIVTGSGLDMVGRVILN